jgi:hypothetical protein
MWYYYIRMKQEFSQSQIELKAYIEAENAKLAAWVAEDVDNRFAGMPTSNPFLTRASKGVLVNEVRKEYIHPNGAGEAWKLDVGAECNRLLEHADNLLIQPKDVRNLIAGDIRSIVARVAEFEELEKEAA